MGNDLFEKAPIPKAYFSFALPVVFSMVICLLYTSPSPRDTERSRMPSSA